MLNSNVQEMSITHKNKTVKIKDIDLVLQSFFCSIIAQVNNAAFLHVHMYVSLYLYPIGVNSNQNAPYGAFWSCFTVPFHLYSIVWLTHHIML